MYRAQSSRGRGRNPQGRGNPSYRGGYKSNFPQLGSSSNSQKTAKEVLIEGEEFDQKMLTKTLKEPIITLEKADLKWFSDPFYLASKYFEIRSHFPIKGRKNRMMYEIILKETGSVYFDHKFRNNESTQSAYAFSKAKIIKIITVSDWGTNPNQERNYFADPEHHFVYNYWDYIDAWLNTFCYQNSQRKHTWFFQFDKDFPSEDIPNWFLLNWEKIGPNKDYLPKDLQSLFIPYYRMHPNFRDEKIDSNKINIALLYFLAQFSIPWIWTWAYSCEYEDFGLPCLARTYSYKWWNKFSITEILKEIPIVCTQFQEEMNSQKKAKSKVEDSKDPLSDIKEKILKENPNISDLDLKKKMKHKLEEFMNNMFKNSEDDMSLGDDNNEDMDDYLGMIPFGSTPETD